MLKFIAAAVLGFTLTGCTIPSLSDIPSREPGSLIIVCPDKQVIINDGKSACMGFMQTEEKAE